MDDATLRARLQDLREGHTGDPHRGADAFEADARWRDNVGTAWIVGRDAIRDHFSDLASTEVLWDPTEVVVEGRTALVRYRLVLGEARREGWARLGLGTERLTSWDAIWAPADR